MDLTYYKPNDIEKWINAKYQENGIYSASDIDIDHIANIFDIDLHIRSTKSFTKWEDGQYSFIIISDQLSPEERREHFFHELCHPLRHVGQQRTMCNAFIELQEIQAAHFQLYAAMPAYMLEEYTDIPPDALIKVLAEDFCLSEQFVTCRLRQIKGRIELGRKDAEALERRKQASQYNLFRVRRLVEEFNQWKRAQQEVR